MERKFTEYLAEIGEGEYEIQYPSTDDAHSKAHKIFVRGSILFSAVDGDMDGYIGADSGTDMSTVNTPEFDYDSEAESGEAAVAENRIDFAYYYLDDARGRVMALLARDVEAGVTPPYIEGGPETEEGNLARILEYYTYNAFGTVTALPVQDRAEAGYPGVRDTGIWQADGLYPGSGSLGQWDRMEDTPLDLSDNAQLMLNRRNGDNNHVASGEHYGRESAWANEMVAEGVRWKAGVGIESMWHSDQGNGPDFLTSTDSHMFAGEIHPPVGRLHFSGSLQEEDIDPSIGDSVTDILESDDCSWELGETYTGEHVKSAVGTLTHWTYIPAHLVVLPQRAIVAASSVAAFSAMIKEQWVTRGDLNFFASEAMRMADKHFQNPEVINLLRNIAKKDCNAPCRRVGPETIIKILSLKASRKIVGKVTVEAPFLAVWRFGKLPLAIVWAYESSVKWKGILSIKFSVWRGYRCTL